MPDAFAARFNAAAMSQHDFASDGQADAESGVCLRVCLPKQVEHVGQGVGLDAASGISDA